MHRFERWREIIQDASNVDAVVAAMRGYVDTVGPAVIGTLPAECQQALSRDDIQQAAVTLLQCELRFRGEPAIAELLHEIAQTFAVASTRVARLTKRGPLPPRAG